MRNIAIVIVLLGVLPMHSISQQRASRQQQLRANAPGGGVAAGTNLPSWPSARNPLDTLTPVTDAMLSKPSAGEWLTWRRTQDDMGFSPLRQINKDNVKNLRVAWSLTLPAGPNEGTPLVHDGVSTSSDQGSSNSLKLVIRTPLGPAPENQ